MQGLMLRAAAIGLALIVGTSIAGAEDSMREPATSSSASGTGPTLHGNLKLSLADAISMGLENNLDVEIERHAPLIADEDLQIAWGAYDPNLEGALGHLDDSQPATISLTGQTRDVQRTTDGSFGVGGLIPLLNATYGIDYRGARDKSNSRIVQFSPRFDSALEFSGSLPLLKGLLWNETWTQVRSSHVLRDSANEDFRTAVMDTVALIESSYWGLVASDEQLRVARKSLDTARALLDQVQTQYEVGVVSKVEVIEAEAGVAERDVNLIRAENRYRSAQDTLINEVLGAHLTAASRLEIEPTDRPGDYVSYEIDVETAVSKAFANRPELRVAESELERNEIQLRFAKNQRLPQLDVQGAYTVNGVTGIGTTTSDFMGGFIVNPTTGTGVGDSNDNFFTNRGGDNWVVRGVFSVPLGNVAGRHGVSKAELEFRRAGVQLERLRQTIILEVRDGARNLRSADRGIEAAERRRAAAEEQLRAERVRLEHGESTPFEVLQREEDLVDAESQKIEALQIYRTSEAELLRAQGTILEARNVVIDDVRPLR